jgi:p-hydroxybenzoate 3-monooxygenase
MLSHLLRLRGIDSVILESCTRRHVEERVRAGVLEQGSVDLMVESGVGDRLLSEGMVHHGIELRFDRRRHRIDLSALTGGRAITIYAQHEVVKDLIAARERAGGEILFNAAGVFVDGLDTPRPRIRYRSDGREQEIECEFVAGCDGSRGVCRPSVRGGEFTVWERIYPYGWLGILAEAPPSSQELVYANHERGFALLSMRTPRISRLYLQCRPDEQLGAWPETRIWEELRRRLETCDGWSLAEGPVLQRGITPMRSVVVEPMQYGRLFLAGDAAHIVPPTGAKGLNLAFSDVTVLAQALGEYYRSGATSLLDRYSSICLRRTWKVQRFSVWMTTMLHRPEGDDGFEHRRQLAELDYVTSSTAAATTLAENYVGLPMDTF